MSRNLDDGRRVLTAYLFQMDSALCESFEREVDAVLTLVAVSSEPDWYSF